MIVDSVAVIVAHADDEVLGCGGSIARFVAQGRKVHLLILSDGVSSRVESDKAINLESLSIRNNAAQAAKEILGISSLTQLCLPDNRLDSLELLDIVKLIESFLLKYPANTILTHHAGDVNIDHRVVHDAVVAASRPQPLSPVNELLFFEIPSSTEWRPYSSGIIFNPNYFIDISEYLDIKLSALTAYRDELREFPHPRSIKAIEALAYWRGATAGLWAAEAFIIGRKILHKENYDN